MAVDPEMLRAVMRHWATGVTVLTTRHGAHTHGMTVSSFTSVSLEPPLVLACLEHGVRTHTLVERSGVFAVIFLRNGQEWISNRFAGRETEDSDRFAGVATHTAVTGAPILSENIGYLDCVVTAGYPSGNHTIFVGEVVAASTGSQAGQHPLVYFDRDYHRLC